jgi:hypothetical protein
MYPDNAFRLQLEGWLALLICTHSRRSPACSTGPLAHMLIAVGCELLLKCTGIQMASFDPSFHRVKESASSDHPPPIPLKVGYRSKCY